ncbi:MAG: TlpA family protein disulfide reductase [Acidobacteria bacterium]|nr:TlpA family protein disulfide reductase [Acidobacteriota bacterium]
MTRRGLILSASALAAQTKTKKAAGPSLKVSLPGGKTMNTAQLIGSPCAVTIFKTNCPHCQKSLPIIEKVMKDFARKGFKAVGVAVDQNPEPLVVDFAKNFKITFPLGWASIEDICKFIDLKPEQLYVPAMMVFDKTGKVRGRYPGGDAFFNMEEANLRNLVEMLV